MAIKRFNSAVDWWFYAVIVLTVLAAFYFAMPTINTEQASIAPITFLFLVFIGLPIWLLFSTNYKVSDRFLHVRSGPLSLEIPINKIHSIEKSGSILAAPALSLKRLKIRYGEDRQVLISPKDRDEFIEAIDRAKSSGG